MESSNENNINFEREKLVKASQLHWLHWFIIALSLLLTIGAWYYAKYQIDEKINSRFTRESEQIVSLISERMAKYEDALWGGVGAIQSHEGDTSVDKWKRFADTLQIGAKYPRINGIGIIDHVTPKQLPSYLEFQRRLRPEYSIHPAHQESEYLPITHIEPVGINAKAVGLDMAHETNRYTAAKKNIRNTETAKWTTSSLWAALSAMTN